MYGARAVLQKIAEVYPSESVSLHMVWLPMVPGDDRRAAVRMGKLFSRHEVHQYYDPEKAVGIAFTRDAFEGCLMKALAATPLDHPAYSGLKEWAAYADQPRPLWDAVLYFPPGIEWADRAPTPFRWSKQVGFVVENGGKVTALFFKNDCEKPPVDSDWHSEVRQAMIELQGVSTNQPRHR